MTSLPLHLQQADLRNVDIHFRRPELTEDLLIEIPRATHQQDTEHNLVLDIDSIIDGKEFYAAGSIGPFPQLIVAGAVVFDLSVSGPNARLSMQGEVEQLRTLRTPNLDLQFSADEVAAVLNTFNLPEVTGGKADLTARIRSEGGGIDGQIKGAVGEFEVDGTTRIARLSPLTGVLVNIKSSGPSALAAGSIVGIPNLPPESYTLDIELAEHAQGLAIDAFRFSTAGATLDAKGLVRDFPELNDIDLDISMEMPSTENFQALLPGTQIPDVGLSVQAELRSDAADASDALKAEITLGTMNGSVTGRLTETPNFVGSTFNYRANFPDTRRLTEFFSLDLRREDSLEVSGDVVVADADTIHASAGGRLGSHRYTFEGDIPLTQEVPELAADLTIAGPDAANLVSLFVPADTVPALPYQLDGKIRVAGRSLGLTPMQLTIGQSRIDARGNIVFGKGMPRARLSLDARGRQLGELLGKFGFTNLPADDYRAAVQLSSSANGVELTGLDLAIAGNELRGSVNSGWPDKPERLDFDVVAKGPSLRSVVPVTESYQPAAVPFEINTRGRIDGQALNLERLVGSLGGTAIEMSGEFTFAPELAAQDLRLNLEGKQISDLGIFNGMQPADLPFSVQATVSGSRDTLDTGELKLQFGKSDLSGSINLQWAEKPRVELRLQSEIMDLRQDEGDYARSLAKAQPTEKPADGRLIPDIDLPFQLLDALDANIALDIGHLIANKVDLRDINIVAQLQDGQLDAPKIAAVANGGDVTARLSVQPAGDTYSTEAWFDASNMIIALGGMDDAFKDDFAGQAINAHMRSSGSNLRAMAAGVDGYIWLRGGQRQIATSKLGFLFGDFLTEVFAAVNPFVKSEPYQTMDCDRVFMEAENGLLSTSPAILLRLEKLNIAAAGTIDLSNEKIDFSVQTTPRKGLGLSTGDIINAFSKISGTLASPTLTLDPTGTLVQGSAAVATMGLSIVAQSLYRRFMGPRDPCEALTREARKIRAKRNPEEVPAD